jgi:ribosomal protein S1
MEEPAFPRGRPDAAVKKKEDENEDETPRDKRFKKRDGTNHHTNKKRPASDFLFGSKKPEKTSKKKKKTTTAADSTVTSSGKKSLLPMGGGGVVFPPDNKPGWIESLSFSKLVKGMRLLGCVREVYADLIVFSLPNLWTGYMLCGSNTKPLVSVGQYMSVVIVKAVQEATKDGPRRRIQVSCLPSVVNTSEKLVGSVRGQVLSAEDHGILVDLGLGRQGFLPYESIEGAFTVDEEFEENGITRILAHKRVDDFLLAQNARDSKVLKLTLPGRKDMAAQFLNETPTLAALQPGALVKVSVESIVRNGVCVSFSSGVFRGAIETSHIGCTFVPENKLPNEQWKALFQDHKKLVARILAVDATSKIVRLSLQPHLITLEPPASLPAVGSVIENATVVRVDPGLGAVLALPGDAEVDENMATSSHNVELWADERYRSTSTVQTVYVHISKAVDEQKGSRTSDAVFAKEFAPSTQHKVRILSNANTIDCIASGATAKSVVEAHVLTIADLTPGKTFRQVPVCAHVNGGGVLVDFGMGVRGLIAPLHLFDHTATSEYRTKMFKELYGLDCKVDVRVLSVDQATKRCYLTAKRSLIKCKEIITSFDDVKIGQQTVGFVSHVDEKSLSVTFFNGVYGKVTARSLAADLGFDNLKENYTVGDAVNCRVANVKQRNRRSKNSVMAEEDDAENIGATYWELTLSLRSSSAKDLDKKSGMEVDPENSNSTAPIALKPGILLPARSMKVVQLQMGKAKDKGFVPGFAIVSIKSKYLLDAKENRKLPQYVECKLPFDQLFDYYDADVASSANAMDALAQEHLKVGEKVDRKGIVLMDPLKSVAEYTTGTGSLAVVSIRPKLVSYFDERHADEQEFKDLICPSPETHLFMGAELLGYVVQVDARHGAFIRFLNGVTGLVPKLKGGLALPLYSTVSTRVIAIDVTALPPKILLGINKKEKPRAEKKRGLPKSYPKEGDTIDKAEIVSLDFHRASLKVLDAALESSDDCRVRLHYSLAKSKPIVKPVEITSADERRQLISRFHPFFGLKTGSVLRNLRVAAVDNRGDKVYYELTNLVQDDTRSPAFFHNVSNVKVGMKVSGTVASIDHSKGGIYLQLCPGVSGFIPALELSEKAEVLNRLDVHYPIGCRLECLVIDKKAWLQNRSKYHVGHVKKMQSKETQNDTPYLSVIKRQIEGSNFVKPTKGSLVLGRINRKVPSANPPALMLDLRGGFIGRCCITEVDEPDDWRNMPIGRISVSESKEPVTAKETQHHPEESDHEEQILRYVIFCAYDPIC